MAEGAAVAASGATLALESVDSTNALARRILGRWGRERPFPGLVVMADEQTIGRGRRGRSWSSPRGRGVYMSVLRALPAAGVDGLPLLVGVAVCDVLRARCALAAGLEWPNDVVVAGRKICGVLAEVVGAGGPTPTAILGVGVNLAHRREDLPRPDATSVALEVGRAPAAADLVPELVTAIDRELRAGERPGYAVRRFAELGVHRPGDEITCREGDRLLRGSYDGLEPSGALRLRCGGRTLIVHDGELTGEREEAGC